MPKTITAVFDTRLDAEFALRKLDESGYTKDQVTMLVSEETRGKHFGIDATSKSDQGAAVGAAVGGLTGALYLALASAGTLLIPGLNLIVSGALVGALAGLGVGGAAGGLVGGLVGLGIPENEAKLYDDAVRKGSILIAVDATTDANAVRITEILKNTTAQSVKPLAA
jgi:hypothetical protein